MKIRFKKIITIILLWSISQSVSAQFLGEDSIYFSADINSGTFFGSDININYINKNDYTFKLGFSANIRSSKSTPSDYKSGITDILLLGLTSPHDIVLNYQCYIGKIYYLNKSKNIRLNMGLGVAYSLINTPTNWVKLEPTIINLGGNYTFDQHKHSTFSLLINPKIEFPITRIFGLSLSPVICINKDITYFGVGIGYMLAIKS